MATLSTGVAASALADGAVRVVWVRSREIAIFRIADRYHAVDNVCPHLGAPLSAGKIACGEVVCPLHGWHIRLEDGFCHERPDRPHTTYAVRIERGEILLEPRID